MDRAEPVGIVILAGGESTRLPGKLFSDAGGMPLLVRVFCNLRDAGNVYVSAASSLPPEVDAQIEAPIVIDRFVKRGPLGGLCSTLPFVREGWFFAVAGDAPFVTEQVVRELQDAWEPGLQAIVPEDAQGRAQPLCALYDRAAFLEHAGAALQAGAGVVCVAERLQTKRPRLRDERVFANVNTISQRETLLSR